MKYIYLVFTYITDENGTEIQTLKEVHAVESTAIESSKKYVDYKTVVTVEKQELL